MKKKLVVHFFGLSGSGKTTFSKKLYNILKKKNKKKIYFLDGDEFRRSKIFKNKSTISKNPYSTKSRSIIAKLKSNYIQKKILHYDIIIFNSISHSKSIRLFFRKKFKNYLEIFIESNFKTAYERKLLQIRNSKKLNVNKITKFKNNLVGKDIKFDISKTWDIKINNSTNRKDINNYTKSNFKLIDLKINEKLKEPKSYF